MKSSLLLAATLACALPVCAQPDPILKATNGLPFPLVTPAQIEKTALAKPIKLDLNAVTLSAALDELQKQSGVELSVPRDAPKETLAKTLSIHLETPSLYRAFAEVMDEAGVKASLTRYDYENGRPWRVNFDQTDSGEQALQAESGLFRTRLMSLNTTLSKNVTLGKTAQSARSEQNNLTVSLALLPDPRVPLLGVPRPLVTRAEDEQGRSLLPKADKTDDGDNWQYSPYSFYSNGYGRSQTSVRLRAPEADAKTLTHFEGKMVYAVVSKIENWEIPDLLAQKEWTRQFKSGNQSFDVTFKPSYKDEKNLTLNVEVRTNFPRIENQIGHPLMASEPVLAAITIRDANGTVLRTSGGGGGTSEQKMTTQANFYPANREYDEDGNVKAKPLAMPLKLSFDAPVEVVQTEVPFSFEDVPLP